MKENKKEWICSVNKKGTMTVPKELRDGLKNGFVFEDGVDNFGQPVLIMVPKK